MSSSRYILQQFNSSDPHANNNNPTRTRLRAKLYNHTPGHGSTPEDNSTKTDSFYKETVTSPDQNVYQIAGSQKKDLDLLKDKLLASHFTAGGNCSEPSSSVRYSLNNLNHHATEPENTLSLQACGTVLIPSAMLQLLGNVTEALNSLPASTSEQWSGQHALIAAIAISFIIGACAFIGAVEYSRMKEEKETGVDADAIKGDYKPVRLR
jgi:hypothetical protein